MKITVTIDAPDTSTHTEIGERLRVVLSSLATGDRGPPKWTIEQHAAEQYRTYHAAAEGNEITLSAEQFDAFRAAMGAP